MTANRILQIAGQLVKANCGRDISGHTFAFLIGVTWGATLLKQAGCGSIILADTLASAKKQTNRGAICAPGRGANVSQGGLGLSCRCSDNEKEDEHA